MPRRTKPYLLTASIRPDIEIDYEEWPFSIPAVQEIGNIDIHLVEDNSQFIIATHSPILLSYPTAKIIQFDGAGVSEVAFEDTEHFAITRDFLNNYPRRLEQLLRDDDEDGVSSDD